MLLPLVAADAELLDHLHGAIDRHPGHDLRVGEVAPAAAHLPDAVVGPLPGLLDELDQLLSRTASPRRCRPGPACAPRRGRRAPRRRRRAGTARRRRCRRAPASSPRSRAARAARTRSGAARPSMSYMICSSPGAPAAARSSQSRNAPRLVDVAADHQRVQRQAGVAQPAEAVVPVAHAADLLGQRRRRRRDDAAGRRVGHRLEREQRAHHGVAPAPLVGAAARPLPPERSVARQRLRRRRAPAGACSCDGYQVSCSGMRSPFLTVQVRPTRARPCCSSVDRRRAGSGRRARPVKRMPVARQLDPAACRRRSRSGRRAASRPAPRPRGPRRCGRRRSARRPSA